jgi:hypothetical protein
MVATASAVPLAARDAEKTPDGIGFEFTPGGFLLRASCRDIVTGLLWTVFVGVLAALLFILWGT